MKGSTKKIILSINTSWNVFNFRLNLIRFLESNNFDVIVVAPEDPYSQKITEAGIKFIPITMENKGTNPISDFKLIQQYKTIFASEQPDLILLYTIKPNIYGSIAAKSLKIPTINNITGLGTAFIRKNWINWVVKKLYKNSLNESKSVFFQNSQDKSLFVDQQLISSKNAKLIPGSGVDTNRFNVKPFPSERIILFIGRLLFDKGIVELLHASEIINKKHPNRLKIKILGKFETEAKLGVSEELIQLYHQKGIIEYLGTTDSVEKEIEKASAIVLPSYREGTSRSLLEAASMGRPLLASNVPGCNNIVRNDVNGWLFKPKSIESLVECLESVISAPQEELIEKGTKSRQIVEKQFGENFVFNSYLNEINTLL